VNDVPPQDSVTQQLYVDSDKDGIPDAFHQRGPFVEEVRKPMPSQHQSVPQQAQQQAARSQQHQTEEIVNVPQAVSAFGRTYEIKRFSLYQFACSLNYITPLSALLQGLTRGQSTPEDRSEWIPAIVGALSMSGDSMMGLISVATYEPLEWLQEEDKDPFEGIELLAVIVEKNLDFFSPEKMAKLKAIADRLTPKINALYGGTLTT
jgi:hypothetical protein